MAPSVSLEIAKGVGPRLPPPLSRCWFFDCSWPQPVGDPTRRGGREDQDASTRLDGRDQVSYSSLRRPAVFSPRGAPWSIPKPSTTGVVSMIGSRHPASP